MKDKYIVAVKEQLKDFPKNRDMLIRQIETFYDANNILNLKNHNYNVGDYVFLKKGTLLHGTSRNIDGLIDIVNNGLIASWFTGSSNTKYPACVGVWNLKYDYKLSDYINFYSGGTIRYYNHDNDLSETEVIEYDKLNSFIDRFEKKDYLVWKMEQTKEARFLPSLVQDKVQIGIIFNSDNDYIQKLLKNDILSLDVTDEDVKIYISEYYYDKFIYDRKNKDDFFTDRESAVLFGIPSCFIEGILVGRKYENDESILDNIKSILPNAYICNLDGKVIKI